MSSSPHGGVVALLCSETDAELFDRGSVFIGGVETQLGATTYAALMISVPSLSPSWIATGSAEAANS